MSRVCEARKPSSISAGRITVRSIEKMVASILKGCSIKIEEK